MKELARRLLAASPARAPIASLDAWWTGHRAATASLASPIDRAIVGGLLADRLGYAFASGYREALVALVPSIPDVGVTILSATEAGGVKPSAIKTALEDRGGQLTLTGEKKWATLLSSPSEPGGLATQAVHLLVAAARGVDDRGRTRLAMVRVPATRAGVSIRTMPAPSFTPELPHAEVSLVDVAVDPSEVLPGDGWDVYLKPFRTVEDVFVHAALLGYLVGAARRAGLPRALLEEAFALVALTRALAAEDPRASSTHIALAGAIDAAKRLVSRVDEAWTEGTDERGRWLRDRPLLSVASSARALRAEAAWRDLGAAEG